MKLLIALCGLILAASAIPAEVPEDYDLGLEMDLGKEMDIPQDLDVPQELDIIQDVPEDYDLGLEMDVGQETDIPQELDNPQEVPEDFDLGLEMDVGQEMDIPQELDSPQEVSEDYDLGLEMDAPQDLDFAEELDQDLDSGNALDSEIPVVIGAVDAGIFNNSARNIPHGQAGFATLNGGTRGGIGGSTWTVWDAGALRNALQGNDRRIVSVRGRIDLSTLFTGSPGVRLRVGNNKSVVGGDRNAMIFGGGLSIVNANQIIVQNIKFHNALSYAPGERPNGNGGISNSRPGEFSEIDAIDITNSVNVWVDHCEFADDPWNANNTPDNRRRHDGLIDIKRAANFISVSNSVFRNHNHNMLVGHSDGNAAQDNNRLKVTYYLNWFRGTNQRNPRVRFGEVHVLNNLYTDIRSYGIGAGAGARVYGERNVFINTRRAWGFPAGRPNPMGNFFNDNNLLRNSNHDSGIPNNVGWRPNQRYRYTPMNVNNVEAHVRRYAGTR